MKIICYLIGCKWAEYTFHTLSLRTCQRCGRALL